MTDTNSSVTLEQLVIKLLSIWTEEARVLFHRNSEWREAKLLDDFEVILGYQVSSLRARQADPDEIEQLRKDARELKALLNIGKEVEETLQKIVPQHTGSNAHPVLEFVTGINNANPINPGEVHITKESAYRWANQHYGKDISEWKPELLAKELELESEGRAAQDRSQQQPLDEKAKWQSVTIRLLVGNKIKFTVNGGKNRTKDLEGTELCDKRKKTLRKAGALLLGLAKNPSIPPGKSSGQRNSMRKAVSILRSCLNEISGITGDPFYQYNPSDGWKPRFRVLDRRKAADERAEEKAHHDPVGEKLAADAQGRLVDQPYDPHKNPYQNDDLDDDTESDAASKFLKDNGR